MLASNPPTATELLMAIMSLQNQLDTDLQNLKAKFPTPTPAQQADILTATDLHDKLENVLTNAASAVQGSTDPITEWSDWVDDDFKKDLKAFAKLISTDVPSASDQLGVCTYPVGGGEFDTACMTLAECNTLAGSSFSQGGCS